MGVSGWWFAGARVREKPGRKKEYEMEEYAPLAWKHVPMSFLIALGTVLGKLLIGIGIIAALVAAGVFYSKMKSGG
jgi:hypothetical protein